MPCFAELAAVVLPGRPDGPTKRREIGSRPINCRRIQSRGQRTVLLRWEGDCKFPNHHAPGLLCAAIPEESQ